MEVIEIQHIDDPRIALYRNIKDRELAEQGDRFMAEGELVVRRMLAGGVKVESVLLDHEKCLNSANTCRGCHGVLGAAGHP
ncbi:MAG: hypothetical protein HC898_06915 [Phycisphaerales bacterium]|nr:hypothetical protein [Phycisphaerales bacterium]